jgi:hypothetical protein
MPTLSEMHPSKWLSAADLDEEDLTVTMKRIEQERIGQGSQADDKWVLYFKGQDKGLVLNKTNAKTIAGLYGDDTDNWMGKPITLFPTQVDMQGKQVDAIRVRNKPPKAKASKPEKTAEAVGATADSDDDGEDIPF